MANDPPEARHRYGCRRSDMAPPGLVKIDWAGDRSAPRPAPTSMISTRDNYRRVQSLEGAGYGQICRR